MMGLFAGFRNAAKLITCRIPDRLYFLPAEVAGVLLGFEAGNRVADGLHALYENASYTKFKPGQEIGYGEEYRLKILGVYNGEYIVCDNKGELDRRNQLNLDNDFWRLPSSKPYTRSDYSQLKYQTGQKLYDDFWRREYVVCGVLKEPKDAARSNYSYILTDSDGNYFKKETQTDIEQGSRYTPVSPLRNKPQQPSLPKLQPVPG